jgi:hypothetical protein
MEQALAAAYTFSFNDPGRAERMRHRFERVGIPLTFVPPVLATDPRIPAEAQHDKALVRNCAIMWNHLDMLRCFLEDPSRPAYGLFCEDDIYIRKDLAELVPLLIALYRAHRIDLFLLGYLELTQIGRVVLSEPQRFAPPSALPDLVVRRYGHYQWGAEMYMVDRNHAATLLDLFNEDFARRSVLKLDNLPPFSPDWTITKYGNKALVYPMMAVEEGQVVADDDWHRNFHANCHKAQYDPDIHI